jgi:hypothetical protein
LSGTTLSKRTDLEGLGIILDRDIKLSKQQKNNTQVTYSILSSSVLGDTMDDAERFLLLQFKPNINISE